MKNKIVICLILTASTGIFADNYYISPAVLVQHISASDSSFWGAHPRLALGYDTKCDRYYFAGELFAIPATATFADNSNPGAVHARATRSYGASFLPGIYLNNILVGYLRLGAVGSKFTEPDATKIGGQVGFGLQTFLNDCWDLRAEYIFTKYENIAGLGAPKSNEIGVGAIYRLNF